jgi:Tol biopolymer transport system component
MTHAVLRFARLLSVFMPCAASALDASPPMREIVDPDGKPVTSPCFVSSVSADGRYLGFGCTAHGLARSGYSFYEAYVLDRNTREIHNVQIDTQGIGRAGGGGGGIVSDDGGRYVFTTQMPLHPDHPPPWPVVPLQPFHPYLRDLQQGTTQLLARDAFGRAVAHVSGAQLQDAAMARHLVLFGVSADLRNPAQPWLQSQQIYVRDWQSGALDLVTETPAGAPSASSGYAGTLSVDGRYVAFQSFATDLGNENPTGTEQLFLRDRVLRTTRRLSWPAAGGEFTTPYYQSSVARFTADARKLLVLSNSKELVAGVASDWLQIYLLDIATRRFELVTRAHGGGPANQANFSPAISGDGRYVAFFSRASDLTPTPQTHPGVYVKDRVTSEVLNITASLDPLVGTYVPYIVMSADGSTVVFDWRVPNDDPRTPWHYAVYSVQLRGVPPVTPTPVPASGALALLLLGGLLATAALFARRRRCISPRASA